MLQEAVPALQAASQALPQAKDQDFDKGTDTTFSTK